MCVISPIASLKKINKEVNPKKKDLRVVGSGSSRIVVGSCKRNQANKVGKKKLYSKIINVIVHNTCVYKQKTSNLKMNLIGTFDSLNTIFLLIHQSTQK